MTVYTYKNDLPASVTFKGSIAVDTETMGLMVHRDRLCLVQICDEKGDCYIVHMCDPNFDAPNLKRVLSDKNLLKIYQYGRFDIAVLKKYLKILAAPAYCTKIASKIARTNAPSHSLKALCASLLGVYLEKEQQTSDWGAPDLNEEQLKYAAGDVLYLHALKEKLDALLEREHRTAYAQMCFDFLPHVAELDLADFSVETIFVH